MSNYHSTVREEGKPDCTASFCGEGHGAKCFNAGRCLREAALKAAAKKKKGAK